MSSFNLSAVFSLAVFSWSNVVFAGTLAPTSSPTVHPDCGMWLHDAFALVNTDFDKVRGDLKEISGDLPARMDVMDGRMDGIDSSIDIVRDSASGKASNLQTQIDKLKVSFYKFIEEQHTPLKKSHEALQKELKKAKSESNLLKSSQVEADAKFMILQTKHFELQGKHNALLEKHNSLEDDLTDLADITFEEEKKEVRRLINAATDSLQSELSSNYLTMSKDLEKTEDNVHSWSLLTFTPSKEIDEYNESSRSELDVRFDDYYKNTEVDELVAEQSSKFDDYYKNTEVDELVAEQSSKLVRVTRQAEEEDPELRCTFEDLHGYVCGNADMVYRDRALPKNAWCFPTGTVPLLDHEEGKIAYRGCNVDFNGTPDVKVVMRPRSRCYFQCFEISF